MRMHQRERLAPRLHLWAGASSALCCRQAPPTDSNALTSRTGSKPLHEAESQHIWNLAKLAFCPSISRSSSGLLCPYDSLPKRSRLSSMHMPEDSRAQCALIPTGLALRYGNILGTARVASARMSGCSSTWVYLHLTAFRFRVSASRPAQLTRCPHSTHLYTSDFKCRYGSSLRRC